MNAGNAGRALRAAVALFAVAVLGVGCAKILVDDTLDESVEQNLCGCTEPPGESAACVSELEKKLSEADDATRAEYLQQYLDNDCGGASCDVVEARCFDNPILCRKESAVCEFSGECCGSTSGKGNVGCGVAFATAHQAVKDKTALESGACAPECTTCEGFASRFDELVEVVEKEGFDCVEIFARLATGAADLGLGQPVCIEGATKIAGVFPCMDAEKKFGGACQDECVRCNAVEATPDEALACITCLQANCVKGVCTRVGPR